MTTSTLRPLLVLTATLAFGLAACAGSAAPSGLPSADPGPSATQTAPPAANAPADPGSGAGGGGTSGDPGSGIGAGPIDPPPFDPTAGQPKLVQAVPGRMNPHPVVPIAIQASVDGRHVLVKLTWYGGVEPCSVLDSVRLERSGNDIALTPIEGSSDGNAICIEIALLKATIVDLGELEPGTWRITSPGSDTQPVVLTIE